MNFKEFDEVIQKYLKTGKVPAEIKNIDPAWLKILYEHARERFQLSPICWPVFAQHIGLSLESEREENK